MSNFRLPNRQQGHISLLMLGMAFVFIACAVMALDTGRLYLERQRLQTQADMAALEVIAYRRFNPAVSCGRLRGVAIGSAKLNGFDAGAGSLKLLHKDLSTEERECVDDETIDGDVVVLLTRSVPDSLVANLAVLWPGSGFDGEITMAARARAALSGPQWVTFSAGGSLLDLDTSRSVLFNALLGKLLGSSVNLDLLAGSGLASTSVSLLTLMQGVGLNLTAASVDQLLGADVTVLDLIEAVISAGGSELGGEQLEALRHLALNLNPALANTTFKLENILEVDPAVKETGGLLTRLSVGSLLDAALYAANGSRAIELNNLALNLGSLTNIGLELRIGRPPILRVGPAGCSDDSLPRCLNGWRTEASSAQLELNLKARLGGLGFLGLQTANINLAISGAKTRVGIANLTPYGDSVYAVRVEGESAALTVMTTIQLLGLVSIANDDPGIPSMRNVAAQTAIWDGRSGTPAGVAMHTGLEGALAAALDSSLGSLRVEVPLLGDLLNAVIPTLLGVVDVLLDLAIPITAVVDPLLVELGVNVGEIEVIIYDVSPGTPVLADVPPPGQ